MKDTIERPTIMRRLTWFVGLWSAGVLTVGSVGAIVRAWLL